MGLGRNFSRRALAVPAVLLAAFLVCPPPFHNHGAEASLAQSWIAARCTATGGSFHFHPARTRLAPDCPACAAGPPASGIPTHVPTLEAFVPVARVVASPAVPVASWEECRSGARAPPLLLGV